MVSFAEKVRNVCSDASAIGAQSLSMAGVSGNVPAKIRVTVSRYNKAFRTSLQATFDWDEQVATIGPKKPKAAIVERKLTGNNAIPVSLWGFCNGKQVSIPDLQEIKSFYNLLTDMLAMSDSKNDDLI